MYKLHCTCRCTSIRRFLFLFLQTCRDNCLWEPSRSPGQPETEVLALHLVAIQANLGRYAWTGPTTGSTLCMMYLCASAASAPSIRNAQMHTNARCNLNPLINVGSVVVGPLLCYLCYPEVQPRHAAPEESSCHILTHAAINCQFRSLLKLTQDYHHHSGLAPTRPLISILEKGSPPIWLWVNTEISENEQNRRPTGGQPTRVTHSHM